MHESWKGEQFFIIIFIQLLFALFIDPWILLTSGKIRAFMAAYYYYD